MNTDKKMDLKKEGSDTQDDSGQPSKDSQKDLKGDKSLPDTGPSEKDEFVKLSKEEYEKLREERNNYKEGLLSTKEKLKQMQEQSPQKEDKSEPQGDYMTKEEFRKLNEKKAVRQFLKQNPEISDKWDSLVEHYHGKRGKDDAEAIVQDLDDAKDLLFKYNPELKPKDNDSKKRSALASDQSYMGKSPLSPGGNPPKKKGGIIPKGNPVDSWYGGEEDKKDD